MLYFNCDYTEGAHPAILEKLAATNMEQTMGYGEDPFCEAARDKIKEACGRTDIAVHFMSGGTQANLTVISAALRAHQGVLSPVSGHINVHETGAVEATGHKVLALDCGPEGKITAAQVEAYCASHFGDVTHEHLVQPGMVYVSHPTESGALYTKGELAALHDTCKKWGLCLFADGARLGYGLAARGTDVTLSDLCTYTDVFYIGGTKIGAMFGEAVVITNETLKRDFRYLIKQKGGMLAKGRFFGLQFLALFENDLYFTISKHANALAYKLAEACKNMGIPLYTNSPTNQQFFILPNPILEELAKSYQYSYWQPHDMGHSVIRLCTSWATREENLNQLITDLGTLYQRYAD